MDIKINGVGYDTDGLVFIGFTAREGISNFSGNVAVPEAEYKSSYMAGTTPSLVAKVLGDMFNPTSKETGETGNLALLDAHRQIRELSEEVATVSAAVTELTVLISNGEGA